MNIVHQVQYCVSYGILQVPTVFFLIFLAFLLRPLAFSRASGSGARRTAVSIYDARLRLRAELCGICCGRSKFASWLFFKRLRSASPSRAGAIETPKQFKILLSVCCLLLCTRNTPLLKTAAARQGLRVVKATK